MLTRLPILMTASVSTRGMKGAVFSDTEREQMYLETLRFYLATLPPDHPIVFAENSGWNLDSFQKKLSSLQLQLPTTTKTEDSTVHLHLEPSPKNENTTVHLQPTPNPRVEFISVDPAICDQSRGKGYNEILLINDAIKRSPSIQRAGAFMKVTGRYPIYNLPRLLKEAERFFANGGQFYGDMKDHKVFDFLFPHNTTKWNGHAMGTAVFATTVDFYNAKLADSYQLCNDYTNHWIEVVWYHILSPYRKKTPTLQLPTTPKPEPSTLQLQLSTSTIHLRFPVEAAYGGWQGSNVKTLACSQNNDSIKARCMRFVGNCIRKFTPWFWF